MLLKMKGEAEVVIVINSEHIENNKVRGDIGITYDVDVLRLIDAFRACGLYVGSVVLTQYNSQPAVVAFQKRLEKLGLTTYKHYRIEGYPSNVKLIVSDDGYGRNEFIQTTRRLVVLTAPGAGSGKMATCLSQLYHEHKRGVKAGYAKFETFPIWNLPLNHPVNIAYEAATADLDDLNCIDPFHLEAYGKQTVNYNRDVEIFPVLHAIMEGILGESPYRSPTDMGVNMAGNCIYDDEAVSDASRMEILRRYFRTAVLDKKTGGDGKAVSRMELLMRQAGVSEDLCPAIAASRKKNETSGTPSGAMVLPDGTVVTAKTSDFFRAPAALLINALKHLAGVPDEDKILSPEALRPILDMKLKYLRHRNPRLHADEVLIALTLSAGESPGAAAALSKLGELRGCNAHFSAMVPEGDEKTYASLGIQATGDPVFLKKTIYNPEKQQM